MARRARKSSGIGSLLFASAVAGVGLSAGRDTYKFTKDNIGTMIAFFVFAGGTAYAAWNMVRGHDRSPAATIGLTYVLNISIIAASTFLCAVVLGNLGGSILVQAVMFIVGLIVGLIQRPGRLRRIKVARQNQSFLEANGFREVGGDGYTLIAPDGAELKLEEERNDALIFKVQGRRSVRAKILIDDKGNMVQYIPV